MGLASLRAVSLGVLGALLLAAPARAEWHTFGGDLEHHFTTTEKLSAPLSVLWKHGKPRANRPPPHAMRQRPAIAAILRFSPARSSAPAHAADVSERRRRRDSAMASNISAGS